MKDSNVEIEIKKIGINGEGIGYYNKNVVFIPNSLPGELVLVHNMENKGSFYTAEVSKIIRKSKDRINPPCKMYNKCQVCSIMPLNYEKQIEAKKTLLLDSIYKYSKKRLRIDEVIKSENNIGYRNTIKLPFFNLKDKLAIGLHKRDTNHYIYLNDCIIQEPQINKTIDSVLSILDEYRYRAYDKKTKIGLRYLIVRSFNKEVMITFVVGKNTKIVDEALDKIEQIKNIISINITTNTKNRNEIIVEPIKNLRGKKSINAKYNDFEFKLSPESFMQLNTEQAIKMYDKIKSYLGKNNKLVLDLYSGVGSITNYVAECTEKIVGIELSKAATKDAKENARKHRIENAEFVAGDVDDVIKRYAKNKNIDAIIVDPPRVGLSEFTIESIVKSKSKKLIYVSCNPSTLGKDLSILLDYYDVRSTTLIDMFPHTMHVETAMLLIRKK
ncbi:23S rRNA (uracil(1939)-C(5))-methyltransferase RlmD [Mycoplasma sp. P36-A1]|uniref:23S rRNA (uracil(1939)-C(5))-methyltransferase RlmD n=1 Tax=Mycoplasma sp. P36-A1 TaxID=3252900 RepID=UPI003C2BA1B5